MNDLLRSLVQPDLRSVFEQPEEDIITSVGALSLAMAFGLRCRVPSFIDTYDPYQPRRKKQSGPVYRDARHRRQLEAKKARQAAAAKRGKRP